MTLTQLEYVIAVFKHGHFGKAAQSCFITQPTLSMQIQKLEDELQVTIFDRSKNPIRPTIEGHAVIQQAHAIINEQKKLFSIVNESKDEIAGDFTLSVIPTLSPYIVPLFIQEFIKAYPKVNIKITENKTEDILELIQEDKIDAALLVTPLEEKNIIERVLYYEPFYLFAASNHPLSKKSKVRQEDLSLDDIWLLNKGNCFRDQVINICSKDKAYEVKNPINFESGSFETLKNMVLKYGGHTLLPYMATINLPSSHKKLVRPFVRPIPTREVSLIHTKSSLKTKIIDALEKIILDSTQKDLRKVKGKSQEIIEIT